MKKTKIFGAAMIALLLLPLSGQALMIQFSLKDLIAHSDLVLQAKTEAVRCAWNDDHTSIYTFVTLSLTDPIVGRPGGNAFTVRYWGGQVGDTTMEVEDAPNFKTGESVIVFLDRSDGGVRRVFGNYQGKFTVADGVVLETRTPVSQFIGRIKTTAQELGRR